MTDRLSEILRVVSVSGGKDSTALYCWAMDQWGRDGFRAVFADTGHEHPVTYNYVRNLPEMAGGPAIDWVKADFSDRLRKQGKNQSGNPFLDLMIWKGRAPSTKAQFCTEHLKLVPIRDWLDAIRSDREVIMYTGIRAGESERRAQMPESEWMDLYDCETVRPLLRWSESQVFEFLKGKGIPPNPLYENGFTRVGCFPCIHARKSELAQLPDWVWQKLEEVKAGHSIMVVHPKQCRRLKPKRSWHGEWMKWHDHEGKPFMIFKVDPTYRSADDVAGLWMTVKEVKA